MGSVGIICGSCISILLYLECKVMAVESCWYERGHKPLYSSLGFRYTEKIRILDLVWLRR